MRVAYDVTPLTNGRTGVARYVRELRDALVRRSEIELVPYAFGRGPLPLDDVVWRSRVPLRAIHASWQVTRWPRVDRRLGPLDLIHCTDMLPPPSRTPRVMTVHDLVAIEHPTLHRPRQVATQQRQLAAARDVDLVFVTTRAVAAALRDRGVTTPIVVAPLAPSPTEPDPGTPVAGRFLLAVGEINERKDLLTLVRAFAAAALPADVRLVLAGPDGWGADAVHAESSDRVVALGHVTEEVLAALYRDAMALCNSSVAEGFNLPIVEAMAAGLPVLATASDGLAEVAGDAAVAIDAGDVDAWATNLRRLVDDESWRADLAARCRVRGSTYTWEATAALVAEAYAQVAR